MKTLSVGMTWLDERTTRWDTEAGWKIALILLSLPVMLPVAFAIGCVLRVLGLFEKQA